MYCPSIWGDGVDARPYGTPSEHEKHVVRRNVEWLTASSESSVNFTPLHELDGIITPNGLCFERHHAGIAEVDPAKQRLMINGLVEKPMVFTMEDLKRFPRENRVYFLECAANSGMEWRGAQLNGCQFTHGMVHNVMYTGVPLKLLLEEAGLKTNAKWLMPEGADASGMNRSVPLMKGMDDCLIAWAMNGEALRPEQGYPLRLVVPGWEGNMWVKWIRRIEVGDEPWHAREETSKYTDLLENGKARRFTWEMDVKSVITNPSPQAPLKHTKGQTVLTGLAWSGRGTIKRVDVSLDGGKNWRTARIDGPSLVEVAAPVLCRFRLGWFAAAAAVARDRQRPARSSQRRTSCAKPVAPTRSTTTTVSRRGTSGKTARLKMSKSLNMATSVKAWIAGRCWQAARGRSRPIVRSRPSAPTGLTCRPSGTISIVPCRSAKPSRWSRTKSMRSRRTF
jgi:sulfane dehydrogenase subunit SoxC